jgi:hypothetical protein
VIHCEDAAERIRMLSFFLCCERPPSFTKRPLVGKENHRSKVRGAEKKKRFHGAKKKKNKEREGGTLLVHFYYFYCFLIFLFFC